MLGYTVFYLIGVHLVFLIFAFMAIGFIVCLKSHKDTVNSKPYEDYIHQKDMLDMEKEKEALIEEYKQLVKELREKVNRA